MQFSEQVIEALKWVGIVFLAGFIGYFGRHLSMILIERFRRKKADRPSEVKTIQEQPSDIAADHEKDRLKLEKKRIKAQKKADKKSSV
jgi:hypothetical protein